MRRWSFKQIKNMLGLNFESFIFFEKIEWTNEKLLPHFLVKIIQIFK